MSLPKYSMREFRASLAHISQPVEVNGGHWFPKEYSWTDIQDIAIRENNDESPGEFDHKAPRPGESHVKSPSERDNPPELPRDDEGADPPSVKPSAVPPSARSQARAQAARDIILRQQAARDAILRRATKRGT